LDLRKITPEMRTANGQEGFDKKAPGAGIGKEETKLGESTAATTDQSPDKTN
jgi:hypothetical protein